MDGARLAELTEAELITLRHALAEYQVLFFRDQFLSPATHRALALRLGTLLSNPAYPVSEDLPEVTILHHDADKLSRIDTWHTDMTYAPDPPEVTILQGQVIPERGGDTLFASCGATWDARSPAMQGLLEPLHAIHDFRLGFKESLSAPGGTERLADAVPPPQRHPVCKRHPYTSRHMLYINHLFTTHIEGLSLPESRAILDFLFNHAKRPEHTVRMHWTPGAIAMWDNRSTWHRPINDHGLRTRTMQRVVVKALYSLA